MYDISKAYSASSNTSGTSSEASETQGVEEVVPIAIVGSSNGFNSRIPKSWKRMKEASNDKDKEGEVKRPPWRAVSVSTLPKPDKNAILRAKLLDASRRLRAGKASVAVQTDIVPLKLLREVNLGTQPDLILYREVGTLTDGCYSRRKQGTDEFILTYSVSQMTDAVQSTSVATQTLLPKVVGDDFLQAYFSCDYKASDSDQFSEVERSLLAQIGKIRESRRLQSTLHGDENVSDGRVDGSSSSSTKCCSKPESITAAGSGNDVISSILANARPSLLQPTIASWHFDYEEPNNEWIAKFQPYTIYPSTRARRNRTAYWPLSIRGDFGRSQHIDSTFLLLAMDKILQESNHLVDVIEDLSTKRSSTTDMAQTRMKPQRVPLLSEFWLPIIKEQEKELEKKLQALKIPTLSKNTELNV